MSELLETAAAALGMPTDLVQRSAAARATENGTTVDDVLTAWAGGAPIAVAVPSAEAQPSEPVVEAPVSEAPPAAVVVLDPPVIEVPAAIEEVPVEAESDERLAPVSMGRRRTEERRVGKERRSRRSQHH